jgi:hypothetical protein
MIERVVIFESEVYLIRKCMVHFMRAIRDGMFPASNSFTSARTCYLIGVVLSICSVTGRLYYYICFKINDLTFVGRNVSTH